jgi:hypothetical protein
MKFIPPAAIGAVTLLFLLLLLPIHSSAALVLFDSESAFLSAAPIVSTETFDEFQTDTQFTSLAVVIDQVVYSTSSAIDINTWRIDVALHDPPKGFSNALHSNDIAENRLTFAGGHVLAFGFSFLGFGFPTDDPFLGWEIAIREVDDTTTVIGPFDTSLLSYHGFLSDVGIVEILVRDAPGDGAGLNWSYDRVSRSAVVSTPPTLVLFGSGLWGLGIAAARRRKMFQCITCRNAALGER